VKRRRVYYSKLIIRTKEMERAKRDGDYGRGIGLVQAEEETKTDSGEAGKGNTDIGGGPAGKKPKVAGGACGEYGHRTWGAKTCANHNDYLAQRMGKEV
jgi:hypothetical protein